MVSFVQYPEVIWLQLMLLLNNWKELLNNWKESLLLKRRKIVLRDFHFAIDCALNACSEPEMQASMDTCKALESLPIFKLPRTCTRPAPHESYIGSNITVKRQKPKAADQFNYFGRSLYQIAANMEVNCRIAKASSAPLCGNVKEWVKQQNWRSTALKYSLPFCMPVKCELYIEGMQS